MKLCRASFPWVAASYLYSTFGAPVSVPTIPAPQIFATRMLP